jgi:hypothetical protein
MANKSDSLRFSIKESGDGFEVLDARGEVIAWALDKHWALRILLGLELVVADEQQPQTDHPG